MTNIFRLMVFLFAAAAVYAQPQVSSQGDDWRLVAYNFARVNNYNIDDKEITMTLGLQPLHGAVPVRGFGPLGGRAFCRDADGLPADRQPL